MTSVASREPRACWEHPVYMAKVTADLPLWAGVVALWRGHLHTHKHTHRAIHVLSDNNSLDKSSTGSLVCVRHTLCSVWRASTCAAKLNVMQSILSLLPCQGYRGGTAHVFSPCVEDENCVLRCETHRDSSCEIDYHS